MAKLSLRQAAEQVDVPKPTILRAIQKGELRATRSDAGGLEIDPAELQRVYGEFRVRRADTVAKGQDAQGDGSVALRAEIDRLKTMVDLMREQLDDVKTQRDGWKMQAENSQRGWFRMGKAS